MLFNTNPYIAGEPVGGTKAFVGREDILEETLGIIESLRENGIVFYGKRHIGKTSVLHELAFRLPKLGLYVPIYFNFGENASLSPEDILRMLSDRILQQFELSPPDPLNNDFLAGFQEEILPYVFSQLPEEASLVFLFDEFDAMDNLGNELVSSVFYPYLRQMLSPNSQDKSDDMRLKFIFVIAGRPHDISGACRSLFDGLKFHHISLLSSEETAALINLSQRNASLKWPDSLLTKIYHLTGGHPYLIQQLCYGVWETIYDMNPEDLPVVRASDIDACLPETLKNAATVLEHLWDGLGLAERVVASSLAEVGPYIINQEEFEKHLKGSGAHILIGNLQNVPKLLEEWDLIQPEENGYRIRIEMWRRWLVQYKPLARVHTEIDRILVAAEHLFKAAHKFYEGGELEEASPLLRQVVNLDPHKRQAYQLLAEIFLAQGNTGEALKLLESLYKSNPWAARPRLIQALVSQAKEKAEERDRLVLYEKILELDPKQPEALAEYKKIYEKRGDAAFKKNQFAAAAEAYRKIGDAQKLRSAESKIYLEKLYEEALEALKSDEREKAQKLLAEILSEDPSFREATRYMHLAVTGTDIIRLKTGFKDVNIEKIWPDFKFFRQAPKPSKTEKNSGQIGTYKLVRRIAKGGMAELFLGVNEKGDFRRTVIIKKVLPHLAEDSQFIAMFKQEARLAALLYHPNIVQIIDFYEEENAIVMEYIRGKNLSQIAAGIDGILPVDQSVFIASQICEGLQYAHSQKDEETGSPLNIIHRDIKPSNILISYNGEVKITDFGISKANAEIGSGFITKPGEIKGTLAYIAPEQASERFSDIDHRCDIFSFGVVFYEMLSGKKLRRFVDKVNPVKAYKLITENGIELIIKLRPEIPVELNRIVMRCLEKDKNLRYQTAQALNEDLKRMRKELKMTYDGSNLADFMKHYIREDELTTEN
jgi:serine/threonine protein kinase